MYPALQRPRANIKSTLGAPNCVEDVDRNMLSCVMLTSTARDRIHVTGFSKEPRTNAGYCWSSVADRGPALRQPFDKSSPRS